MDTSTNAPDLMLGRLVYWIDGAHDTMDVTLTVGGLVISGTLISEAEYEERVGEILGFLLPRDQDDGTGATLLESPERAAIPAFIHLKDTRFVWSEGPAYGSLGMLWRGRLSDVNGWCLGSISSDEDAGWPVAETAEQMLRNVSGHAFHSALHFVGGAEEQEATSTSCNG